MAPAESLPTAEPTQTRTVWCIPCAHPAAILRGAWAREPLQWEYLRRALLLSQEAWRPKVNQALIQGVTLDPTLPQLEAWVQQVLGRGDPLSVDVECAGPHLVCVGFCSVTDLSGVVVRFRGPRGQPHWPDPLLPRVVELTWDLLAGGNPKWFHNGQGFDVPYLEFQEFEVANYVGDTMLMQRYLFPEQPADLQTLAVFYAEMEPWKVMADAINEDEEGDEK